MRKIVLGSLTTLLTGAGLALAQTPPADLVPPSQSRAVKAASADGSDPAFAPVGAKCSPACPPAAACPTACPPEKKADCKDVLSLPDNGNAFGPSPTPCPPPPPHRSMIPALPEYPHVPSPGKYWASADFIYWSQKTDLTGPLVGTPSLVNGDLIALYDRAAYGFANGLRVSAGMANETGNVGVEGSFFHLEQRASGIVAGSDAGGTPLLAREATDAATGGPVLFPISAPGAEAGVVIVRATSRLWGTDGYFVVNCDWGHEDCSLEFLAGFQYLDLSENLSYAQASTLLPGGAANFGAAPLLPPAAISVAERFGAHNQFFGPEFGVQMEKRFGSLFVDGCVKCGVGDSHQVKNVAGASAVDVGAGPMVIPGGITASGDLLGRTSTDRFAVVPSVSANLGFNVTDCVRIYGGYTFLYWSDVTRPGDLTSVAVATETVPTSPNFGVPNPPFVSVKHSAYYVHGFNAGLVIRY
jgi:hypothetical protein